MIDLPDNSNKDKRILLTRNTPVALIVGVAGFFGSHLADKLLTKGIQVVGIDDLSLGKKENLTDAIENKNFHLINERAENLDLDLNRLDYIFITSLQEIRLDNILQLFQKHKCRLLFISSIELYNEHTKSEGMEWFKKAESQIARVAKGDNLNARILRLGPLYGPRMNFNNTDSVARLIYGSLKNDLQKEVSLDFSSRTLYIDDAVELAIKCIFAGATAQKIFDGVLPTPIKLSDIKQVLLDPLWYEEKGFNPQELPPWTTPNLERTVKFLHWHPGTNLVEGLKRTLSYFKNKEVELEEENKAQYKPEKEEKNEWRAEKIEDLEGLKQGEQEKIKEESHSSSKRANWKFPGLYSVVVFLLTFGIIIYGLIWPVISLSWGVLTFRLQLLEAVKALEKGEFDKSLLAVKQAQVGVVQANSIFYSLEPIRKTGILKTQFEGGDYLSNLAGLSVSSAQNTILGVQALFQATKAVTGELTEDQNIYFKQAKINLAQADEDLSKAFALLGSESFQSTVPGLLEARVKSLKDRLQLYSVLVKKARALSILLPEVVGREGEKTYLVLLQNNHELRPGGGFIGSFAKVSFEAGKLKNLNVNDIYAIDGQLKIHVEPPKEIKEDLDQKDFFLRDSNWEPDFPTSARQAEWFYTKETGERVEGVIALDISAAADLLSAVGPLDLPDYDEKVSSENLFERSIAHSELGFFPGSQAKKSFLTSLTAALFNHLFFLPNQNWPAVVSSLGRSLQQKHMSIYLDNPELFSYIISQNWAAVLPRPPTEKTAAVADFLASVEANLGANKVNYYLDRSYNLETVIGRDGDISHRLRISYTNRSPSEVFPGGKYKNRMRVYLPAGTKLNRGLWGEKDITSAINSFSDYGRLGLSFLLELAPKEQKTLVLDYQIAEKLEFINGVAKYRLDIIKQAGTLQDPFSWRVSFPLSMTLSSTQTQKISPQEQTIQTDLSQDRSFELEFNR